MASVINWVKPTLLSLTLFTTGASAGWFDDEPLRAAADMRYGAALYEFYQDKNLEALSELMVAEARGGIQGHGDNPEIMAGGFYMAYGMRDVAADVFDRLLNPNRPVRTRDAAWFYLARLRYLHGDFSGSEQVLTNISEQPHKSIANEIKVLRFNLALQTDRFDQAKAYLEDEELQQSDWMPYLLFNLGAGYSRVKQWAEGAAYFSQLTSMRERSGEHLALYDKAMTAEGYSHLFNNNYNQAIAGFKKVRLDSPLASRALLGFGWAAFELEDYNLALTPWQVLAKRPLVDENVQESWIAIPTVYEKLGYKSVALEQYQKAEAAYANEINSLSHTLTNMKGNAIRTALNIDRSEDFDWLDYAAKNELAPELIYLVNVFSQDRFLRSSQVLRDLLAIQANFLQWQQKLELYAEMLNEREVNRAEDLDTIKQQAINSKIAALTATRNQLSQQINTLETNNDFLALVALDETKRRERVLNAQRNAELLNRAATNGVTVMEPAELALLSETARIHKGRLTWQSAMMNDERLTRAKKQLALVDNTLTNIQATTDRVGRIASQGFDLTPYRDKIESAQEKLIWQTSSVEIEINKAQDALRNQVRQALAGERKRLMHYLGQARLSTARLMDSAFEESQKPVSEPGPDAPNGPDTAQELEPTPQSSNTAESADADSTADDQAPNQEQSSNNPEGEAQ